jgi:hypothetical protein
MLLFRVEGDGLEPVTLPTTRRDALCLSFFQIQNKIDKKSSYKINRNCLFFNVGDEGLEPPTPSV